MARKKFLVTGATGATGGYAVERLLERGHAVRALAHREDDRSKRLEKMGAEVLIADLLKFNDVRTALGGIRGAYFVYPLSPTLVQATVIFAQKPATGFDGKTTAEDIHQLVSKLGFKKIFLVAHDIGARQLIHMQ